MASSGALSRSRYLLEQERKKEEEEKKRVAHAAKLFESKAKKIEATFEATRLQREETQRKELEIEVQLQREKFQRDKKRAEEVKAAFATQKEATRQYFLKDIMWRKKCYAASLRNNCLPFEPSLSGILMSCSVESAYSSVDDKDTGPVPGNVLRHVRALFPQVTEMHENKVQSVDDLVKDLHMRSSYPHMGPLLSPARHAIYVTIIGESPAGWGEALVDFCKGWLGATVPVKLVTGVCPSHRWGNILKKPPPPNKKEMKEEEEKQLEKESKLQLVLPPVKSTKLDTRDKPLFHTGTEIDLFEAHDYLGRSLRESSTVSDGAVLIAFSLSDVLNPKGQAKIAAKIAAERVRPRFVTESVAQEAKAAHEAEIEHAANLKEYAKIIAPTSTSHWSIQSIDPAQHTAVVSLFPPKLRKSFKRKFRDAQDSFIEEEGGTPLSGITNNNESSCDSKEGTVPSSVNYSVRRSDELLRNVLGSIPVAALTLLGMKPCLYGYACSHQPLPTRSPSTMSSYKAGSSIDIDSDDPDKILGVLHSCPICLAKMAVITQHCKSAFSPVVRERLILSSLTTHLHLKRTLPYVHESLEWSKALLSAVELQVFGSAPDASAAYAAWKKCTPKHFEKFRHTFKSLHDDGGRDLSEEKWKECELSLQKSFNNHPSDPPPYPSDKRIEQPRQRPSNIMEKDVAKLHPWRAGPDMVWNDHSLVVRERSIEALPQEYWKDPLKTKFGGISEGQHPPKQIVNKFQHVDDPFLVSNQDISTSEINQNVQGSDFTIKRAGGMYAYGSFELERARILPKASDESVRKPKDNEKNIGMEEGFEEDRDGLEVVNTLATKSQTAGGPHSVTSPKSPLQKRGKLKKKKSRRMKK